MKIELKVVFENPDGSADVIVDYDEAGLQVLIQYGLISILKEGFGNEKNITRFAVDKCMPSGSDCNGTESVGR